jgi:PqqD family protein of HPr-rel-A system
MDQQVDKQTIDQGVWLAVAPDGWEWAQWEDGYCLFDAEAGDTHVLNELSAALLTYIAKHPRTTDWLCATTAELCEIRPDGAWRSKVQAILTGLGELELIERKASRVSHSARSLMSEDALAHAVPDEVQMAAPSVCN